MLAPIVSIQQVSKRFSSQKKQETVLEQISFDVHKGEIIVILGKSGCGKSTLLNLVGVLSKRLVAPFY